MIKKAIDSMPRIMQPTRDPEDIDLDDEDEHDYEPYADPRNFVGPYDNVVPRGAQRQPMERRRMEQRAYLAAAIAGIGDPNKAVTSATAVTSAQAMGSTNELCLYLMDTCIPHCPKNCTSCQPRWSQLPSPEAEKAHIAAMENDHGIVKRISPKEDNKTVRVDVQNKHMKDILTNVFDGYPEFHASLLPPDSAWIFNEPFEIFVGRWDQLREYRLRTPLAAEKEAWVALVAAMGPVVQPTLDAIKRIRDTGLVLWKDLSLIFPPGKLIIIEEPGAVQSVVRMQEGKPAFDHFNQRVYRLRFEYVDWNGEMHGLRTTDLDIREYTGHKKVRVPNLKAMPLDFCPSAEELRTKLIARGRRWGSLLGVEYRQFGGKKVPVTTQIPIEVSTSHRYVQTLVC